MNNHGLALINGFNAFFDIFGVREKKIYALVGLEVPFFEKVKRDPEQTSGLRL